MSTAEDLYRSPLDQIVTECASKTRVGYGQGMTYTFADGSIIWIDQMGQRQAYLCNGWNVTPTSIQTKTEQ